VAGPHQRRELGVGMGRPQMLHDHSLAVLGLHDLHRGRTRPGLHFPQIRAHKPDSNRPLVPEKHQPRAPDKHKQSRNTPTCGSQVQSIDGIQSHPYLAQRAKLGG